MLAVDTVEEAAIRVRDLRDIDMEGRRSGGDDGHDEPGHESAGDR